MRETAAGLAWFVFLAGTPSILLAQDANAPLTAPTQAGAPATTATPTAEQGELNINDVVRQLEERSRALDERQAALEEQVRLLNERAQAQTEGEAQLRERELQFAEREQQLAAYEQQLAEREQVLATQVPMMPPTGNLGMAAPGIESPPGIPTPPSSFREPDQFAPGHDKRTFEPGPASDFSAGPQDTQNNFISP